MYVIVASMWLLTIVCNVLALLHVITHPCWSFRCLSSGHARQGMCSVCGLVDVLTNAPGCTLVKAYIAIGMYVHSRLSMTTSLTLASLTEIKQLFQHFNPLIMMPVLALKC